MKTNWTRGINRKNLKFNAILSRNLILVPLLFSSLLFSQTKNKKTDIKGIDFKLGPTFLDISGNDACQIYSAIVMPDLEKNGLTVKGFENGDSYPLSMSMYLGFVSSNQKFNKSKFFKNSEKRFGVTIARFNQRQGIIGCDVIFRNDTSHNLINEGQIAYTSYGVNADYTFNSKPFLRNFATYLSLGTSIILHYYRAVGPAGAWFKRAEPVINRYPPIEMTNTKTTLTSIDGKAFLGIKYNFSCDLNLFIECGFGGSYYHRGLYGKSKLIKSANMTLLGMRYKFVNEDDKSKPNSGVFW